MKYLINNYEGIQCEENELHDFIENENNTYFAILDDSNMLHIGNGPFAFLIPFASPVLCGSVLIKANNLNEAMKLFHSIAIKIKKPIKAVGVARRITNYV